MKTTLILTLVLLSQMAAARTLKLMQYNAENFFDTKIDKGTEDFTYIPMALKKTLPRHTQLCQSITSSSSRELCLKLDWNEARFSRKLQNIAQVIRSYDASAKGPDILVLQEIENKNVLSQLVSKGLAGLGYQYYALIEGDDSRGIDVAIISKFPIVAAVRHPLFLNGQKLDTRGILEAVINVHGQSVVVFANHWPSQSNPTAERVASAQLLEKVANRGRADLVLAVGDFNVLPEETPHPFSFLPSFVDAETMARQVQTLPLPGTRFKSNRWSSPDRILVHKASALRPQYDRFQIIARPFMMRFDSATNQYLPIGFDFEAASGFSDHLPLGLEVFY